MELQPCRKKRRVCTGCGEELGNTAYYRHLRHSTGVVCGGKARKQSGGSGGGGDVEGTSCSSYEEDHAGEYDWLTSSSEESYHSRFTLKSNTTNSSLDGDPQNDQISSDDLCSTNRNDAEIMSDSEISEITTDTDSCEEVWDTESSEGESSESTSPEQEEAHTILRGLSLFFKFFHLFFRLSERALLTLLIFLRIMLQYVSFVTPGGHKVIDTLLRNFPRSLYSIRKLIRRDSGNLVEYALCPKCDQLYLLSECAVNGKIVAKMCDYIEFPNHTHKEKRAKCNTPPMKQIRVCKNSKFVPRKLFVYNSIIFTLKSFVQRKEFLQKCELWRKRTVPRETLADIYDGDVWKNLQFIDGKPFLAAPGNLCLTVNVDWFNPFKRTPYSAGVIYLIVQNMQREEGYKIENVILAGIIPGPKEPKNMNSLLDPIVSDLNKLLMKNPTSLSTVRAVLSCCVSDMPATRKLCGFLSFHAKMGCSKCMKQFPRFSSINKSDFSGFDVENWNDRQCEVHLQKAREARDANNKKARESIEGSYGARFSLLHNLICFNVVRCHVVDPMHNLFLGITKHAVDTWKKTSTLTDSDCRKVQSIVDVVNPPPGIGRIPRKIGSEFTAVTADEWKNWTIIYSVYALHDILPPEKFQCWCLFVDACRIQCRLVITKDDVHKAHNLIVEYCNTFEDLYGAIYCTPNMHMACHLKRCILDYGPIMSFWAFSFERYNGTLEGLQKSWCGPEKQMLKKFIGLQAGTLGNSNDEGNKFVNAILEGGLMSSSNSHSTFTTHDQTSLNSLSLIEHTVYYTCPIQSIDATLKNNYLLSQPKKEKCLTSAQFEDLVIVYKALNPDCVSITTCRFYYEHKQVILAGEEYISERSRSTHSSFIAAYWCDDYLTGKINTSPLRIGAIKSIIVHKVQLGENGTTQQKSNCFAIVEWLKEHPHTYFLHFSVIITTTLLEEPSPASFIPIARIGGRCAILRNIQFSFDYGEDTICLAIPIFKTSM